MKGCRRGMLLFCTIPYTQAMQSTSALKIFADVTQPHAHIVIKAYDDFYGTKAIFPGGVTTIFVRNHEIVKIDIQWHNAYSSEDILELWELSLNDAEAKIQNKSLSIEALLSTSQKIINHLLENETISREILRDAQLSPRICIPEHHLEQFPFKAAWVTHIITSRVTSPTAEELAKRAHAVATWGVSFNPFKTAPGDKSET